MLDVKRLSPYLRVYGANPKIEVSENDKPPRIENASEADFKALKGHLLGVQKIR